MGSERQCVAAAAVAAVGVGMVRTNGRVGERKAVREWRRVETSSSRFKS